MDEEASINEQRVILRRTDEVRRRISMSWIEALLIGRKSRRDG